MVMLWCYDLSIQMLDFTYWLWTIVLNFEQKFYKKFKTTFHNQYLKSNICIGGSSHRSIITSLGIVVVNYLKKLSLQLFVLSELKQLSIHVLKLHPPHRCPAEFSYVLLYSPYLCGKKLFSMQDKLVNNKHTFSNKTSLPQ